MSPNPSGCIVAAILLLMGANLVIDPDDFSTLANNLTTVLHFELHSRGRWRDPWRRQGRGYLRMDVSLSKTAGRIGGMILIAVGLLIAAVS
jgi:hypothetical protein